MLECTYDIVFYVGRIYNYTLASQFFYHLLFESETIRLVTYTEYNIIYIYTYIIYLQKKKWYYGTAAATATDYYGSYYAEYYSRYYAYYYSSVLGDGFVDDVLGL